MLTSAVANVGGRISAGTDQNGRYSIGGLGAGEYSIRLTVWAGESSQLTRDIKGIKVAAGKTTTRNVTYSGRASLEGGFSAPYRDLEWFVQVFESTGQGESPAGSDRLRATVWNVQKSGRYRIDSLDAGTYRVTASCRPKAQDGKMTIVHSKSQVITLGGEQNAEVDFRFP